MVKLWYRAALDEHPVYSGGDDKMPGAVIYLERGAGLSK